MIWNKSIPLNIMKELCRSDKRNLAFGISLETLKDILSQVPASEKVPVKIREMLEFAKKICLFGYYDYDFYTLCRSIYYYLPRLPLKKDF